MIERKKNKNRIINFQIVSDSRQFGMENQFIHWIYTYFLRTTVGIEKYNDGMTNIHIGNHFEEDIKVDEQDKQKIRGIYIKYDIEQYFKLKIDERKNEINKIFKNAFCALFIKLDLDESIIINIHNNIIKNNYEFILPYKKKEVMSNLCNASIQVKAQIDRVNYFVRFLNKSENTYIDVEFFVTWAGCSMFSRFENIKWINECEEILITDKYEEVEIYVSKKKQVKINIIERIHNKEQVLKNLEIFRFGTPDDKVIEFVKSDMMYF